MKTLHNFSRIAETEFALSTDYVNILYYDLPKHFHGEYRSYDVPRLCTILQGSKKVRINQSENFSYQKDKCVLLPPYASVHMRMSEYTRALVYEFNDNLVDDVRTKLSDQLEISDPLKFDNNQYQIESLQNRLHILHLRTQEILQGKNGDLSFLLDLVGQEMVYELLKRQGCHQILSQYRNHPINKSIRMIRASKGNCLSVSDLAEEVGMSLPNFSQKFKFITDQTPKEFITQLRLNQSKRNLRLMSVTDTALEAGYENLSHFIRVFKKEFGITPKQYQLHQLQCENS